MIRQWIAAGMLLFLTGLLAACNIVGPAVVLAEGPPKADAVYELPPDRPTVVFVDDRDNRLPRRSLRLVVAEAAQDVLMKEGVVKPAMMIDSRATQTIIARETAGQLMDITTVGRQVQARSVVYVVPVSFALSPDGQTYQPQAELYVKVLDVDREQPRLWPPEPEGYRVVVTPPRRPGDIPQRPADVVREEEALARECGRAVARLFFRHELGGRAIDTRGRGY